MYKAYVTTLKNVRKHPNADKLLLADCFGNIVCVSLDYVEGMVGVYFPTDGKLSEEFCAQHNLVRKKDENGVNIGGYLDPEKRNVTAIKLRGEKSDGLFMPINCLDYCFDKGTAVENLSVGDTIDIVNGHLICEKYIPKKENRTSAGGAGTRAHRRAKRSIAPTFFEHADTEQLAYNLAAFKSGDLVEITLKMHGTSQRTGYLKVFKGYKYKNFIEKWFAEGALKAEKANGGEMMPWDEKIYNWIMNRATPIYDWDYVSGTRRTVLDDFEGGFYGSNAFRETHARQFEGKLRKGETIYYEVVGFTDTGAGIMGAGNNEKLGKDFVKQYGKETIFSYGCEPHPSSIECLGPSAMNFDNGVIPSTLYATKEELPQSDMYVYRMTSTNEDGEVVEYTPDFMRYRCEQMGVKCVPVFWTGFVPENPASADDPTITAGEWIKNKAELFYEGPDPIGKTHVREGVVVRVINRPKFTAYKHKNFEFKVLEGIIKDVAEAPDMEEAQEVEGE